jgi:hypothetical protein
MKETPDIMFALHPYDDSSEDRFSRNSCCNQDPYIKDAKRGSNRSIGKNLLFFL